MKSLKMAAIALSCLFVLKAQAHSPFLLPNVFETAEDGVITLDGSFGEYFFVPDGVFTGSVFEVRGPDGKSVKPDTLMELKTRVVLEHTMPADGTYRFSTGWRAGNAVKTYELDGKTARLRSVDDPLPQGAKLTAYYQGRILAETYATKGAPSVAGTGALTPRGDGLELLANANPNELFVGKAFPMQVLVSGKAVAGAEVDIYLAAKQAENSEPDLKLTSDARGMIEFTPAAPGIYVFRTRHNIAGADTNTPEIRYTYSLVLEATK